MIIGGYILNLECARTGDGCQGHAKFDAINETRARAEARHDGWLFKGDDVLCPKCAEPYRREPRYPGGRRL